MPPITPNSALVAALNRRMAGVPQSPIATLAAAPLSNIDFSQMYAGAGAAPPAAPPSSDFGTAMSRQALGIGDPTSSSNLDNGKPQPAVPGDDGSQVRDTIGRALMGFARGMQATPQGAYANPIAGGIAGGLAGTGEGIQQAYLRRLALEMPYFKTQAEEAAKEPFAEKKLQVEHDLYSQGGGPMLRTDADTGMMFYGKPSRGGTEWSPVPMGQALTPDRKAALQRGLATGQVTEDMLSRGGPKLQLLADQLLADPNFDAKKGVVDLAGQRARASATGNVQGGQGFQMGATSGSLEDVLNRAEPLVASLSPSSLQIANEAWQKGLQKTNDPRANELLNLMGSARGLRAQILQGNGVPTDIAMKMANDDIASGLNPNGFAGMKNALLFEGASRAGRLSGQIPTSTPPLSSIPTTGPAGGMVRVMSPDGKQGTIPAAKLSAALSRGFRQI